MKIVLQCAGQKQNGAGLLRDEACAEVFFVACPDLCTHTPPAARPCRPDAPADPGAGTWRDVLTRYNERYHREGLNPDCLLPAGDLYSPYVYRGLVDAFGPANVYILSAGWGLVRADFLLPDYNITFSKGEKVPRYAWRDQRESDSWRDYNHLRDASLRLDEPVHFFGSLAYLPLYYRLADGLSGRKVIHHKAKLSHRACYAYEADTGRRNQNWHYPAAEAFIRSHPEEAS